MYACMYACESVNLFFHLYGQRGFSEYLRVKSLLLMFITVWGWAFLRILKIYTNKTTLKRKICRPCNLQVCAIFIPVSNSSQNLKNNLLLKLEVLKIVWYDCCCCSPQEFSVWNLEYTWKGELVMLSKTK